MAGRPCIMSMSRKLTEQKRSVFGSEHFLSKKLSLCNFVFENTQSIFIPACQTTDIIIFSEMLNFVCSILIKTRISIQYQIKKCYKTVVDISLLRLEDFIVNLCKWFQKLMGPMEERNKIFSIFLHVYFFRSSTFICHI